MRGVSAFEIARLKHSRDGRSAKDSLFGRLERLRAPFVTAPLTVYVICYMYIYR